MLRFEFFSQLFQQFVSVISAFCIAPVQSPPAMYVVDDPPPQATAAIAEPVGKRPGTAISQVIETQIRGALQMGAFVALTADRATYAALETPTVLARSLDRNGLAGLPGGGADLAAGYVTIAEWTATDLVRLLERITLANLDLLSGGVNEAPVDAYALAGGEFGDDGLPKGSLLERIIQTNIRGITAVSESTMKAVTSIGAAVLAAPSTVAAYVEKNGIAALPAAFAAATREIVVVAADSTIGVIQSVADFARAKLALVPGSRAGGGEVKALAVEVPVRGMGPVERIVRIPLAVGVAAAELARTAMRATVTVTGAAAEAAVSVIRSVVDPKSETTLPQALANVPATLHKGVVTAREEAAYGVEKAREEFRAVLRGRNAAEEMSYKGTTVRVSGGAEIRSNSPTPTGVTDPSGETNPGGDGDGVEQLSGVTPGVTVGVDPGPGPDQGAGTGPEAGTDPSAGADDAAGANDAAA